MNRPEIEAEIARLEAVTPSRFASFNVDRAERLASLRATLETMPAAAPTEDPSLVRWMDGQRRAQNAQRAQERRGY